jgi:hypothetical protein
MINRMKYVAGGTPTDGLKAIWHILKRPQYFVLAIVAIFLIPGTLIWLFDLRSLAYILSVTQLSLPERLSYIGSAYTNSFCYFNDPFVLTRALYALFGGIECSVLVYLFGGHGSHVSWQDRKVMHFIASLFIIGVIASLSSSFSSTSTSYGFSSINFGITGSVIAIALVIYVLFRQADILAKVK